MLFELKLYVTLLLQQKLHAAKFSFYHFGMIPLRPAIFFFIIIASIQYGALISQPLISGAKWPSPTLRRIQNCSDILDLYSNKIVHRYRIKIPSDGCRISLTKFPMSVRSYDCQSNLNLQKSICLFFLVLGLYPFAHASIELYICQWWASHY